MPVAEKHQGDWKRPFTAVRRRAGAWAPPALLLLVLVLFYWKLTLSNQYSWLDSPDFANQVLPWFQVQAGEWHAGRFPAWDPYMWGGQPLPGQVLPGAAYPPNWLLFLWPLKNGWIRLGALHWYYVLIHYMAALFAYWLCRDLGRSRAASLLAGLAFSVAGWMGATEWPQMMNGAVWTPLVVLFLLRVLRGERPLASASLAGAFLGVAFLSGHHQVPTFVTLVCAGVWLFGLRREGRWHRELLAPAAAFALFLLLVGALQAIPAYEYGRVALRWVGGPGPVGWDQPVPYSVHAEFGLRPLSILGIVIPGILRHANPYLGFVPVALAILGIAARWREWQVRVLASIAIGGLVFSLAQHGVFEGILYALVPMVEKARNPSMAIFIFHFGIIILSTYGIDSYTSRPESSKRLWQGLACAGALIFLLLLGATVAGQNHSLDYDMVALAAFSALLLAAILYAWQGGHIQPRTAHVLVALLLMMDAGGTGVCFHWRHRDDPAFQLSRLAKHADIAAFLARQQVPVRVEVDEEEIPYLFGDWYGMDQVGGNTTSMLANVQRMQGKYRARMLLATNFSVTRKETREHQVEVYNSQGGLKVYLNQQAFPRAWSVHHAERVSGYDEAGSRLDREPLISLRQRTFQTGAPPELATCSAPDRVRYAGRSSQRVWIEAVMGCRGMVIAADPFFPGWEATVDGKPVQIHEAYGFLRGVVVEGGSHQVVFRYRPKSVAWGGALTGLGLAAALLIGLWPVFRRPGS